MNRLCLLFLTLLLPGWCLADTGRPRPEQMPKHPDVIEEELINAVVAAPYIELSKGPGRGYPVFYVAERDEIVRIIKRRTDWFKVETRRGYKGWVHRKQMAQTTSKTGEPLALRSSGFDSYKESKWEFGIASGDLEGANALSGNVAYRMTNNLTIDAEFTQAVGNFSDLLLANVSIENQPFPEWKLSPYFSLGAGVIKIEPSATLVQTEDRQDNTVHVGVGARYYVTRRMLFRVEYRNYVVLTSRDDNEEVKEWKAGISVFF